MALTPEEHYDATETLKSFDIPVEGIIVGNTRNYSRPYFGIYPVFHWVGIAYDTSDLMAEGTIE
jgi:hypothetical protein